MRLRPSGSRGRSRRSSSFDRSTSETEAWTWEHMALTAPASSSARLHCARASRRPIRELLRGRAIAPRSPATCAKCARALQGEGHRRHLGAEAGARRAGRPRVHRPVPATRARGAPIRRSSIPQQRVCSPKAARLGRCRSRRRSVAAGSAALSRSDADFSGCASPVRSIPEPGVSELLGVLVRAADVPDFATLEAHLIDTQAKVRASFVRILGDTP